MPTIQIHRRLPSSQLYACSKRDAKMGLANLDTAEVHFGPSATFEFDSRCTPRPKLSGSVVAATTIDRERNVRINLYPMAAAAFSEREGRLFVSTQLPAIAVWCSAVLELPDTQVVGHQQLIVESVVDGFRQHTVSFL